MQKHDIYADVAIETVDRCTVWRIWQGWDAEHNPNEYGYPIRLQNTTRAVRDVLRGRSVDVRGRSSHDDVFLVDNNGKRTLIGTVSELWNGLVLVQPMGDRTRPNECRAWVYPISGIGD